MAWLVSREELIVQSDQYHKRDKMIAESFVRRRNKMDPKAANRDILWNVSTFSYALPPRTRAEIFPPVEKES